jgi:hypothetical protein
MWKSLFPLLLVLASPVLSAADNPFLPPSQRESARLALQAQSQVADAAKNDSYMSDVITPDIEELLNSKKDEATIERYVGRINGKDVFFSESKGVYIYKELLK